MVQECRLQQKQGSKSPADWINMEFNDGKDIYVYTKDKKLILKRELLPSDETMMVKISPQNPYFGIKYDDDVRVKGNDEIFRDLARLIQFNQNVLTVDKIDQNGIHVYSDKGNPNLTVHKFDFVNQTAIATTNYITLKNHIRAEMIVMKMNKEQKKEVMYHFGYNPEGLTHSQITMRLIEPNAGIVLNRARYDDKIVNGHTVGRSYLEYFVDRYANASEEIMLQTLVLKSLLIKMSDGRNIVEKRANGYYFINENSIGQNLEEAINYLKRNPKDLEYVTNNVEKNDHLVEDDIPGLLLAKGIKDTDDGVEEQSKSDLLNNEAFQEQQRLLSVARNKFRMTLTDELSISEIQRKIEEGKKVFYRLNFFPDVKKAMEQHPEWKFERVVEEKERAELAQKHKKELKKKNKFVVVSREIEM